MRYSSKGFTLIEIMMVLALLGVVLGLFSANLSTSPHQQLLREAKRLQAVLIQASDEAVSQGIELSLALPDTGYQILQFNTKTLNWEPSNDKPFIAYQLPEAINLELILSDKSFSEQQRKQINRLKKQQGGGLSPPVVLLLSSGELSPFELNLTIQGLDEGLMISSDGYSGVTLQ